MPGEDGLGDVLREIEAPLARWFESNVTVDHGYRDSGLRERHVIRFLQGVEAWRVANASFIREKSATR